MNGSGIVRDAPAGPCAAALHVLVADDDPASRRFFGDGLVGLGARVRSCADGAEALACATRERFDILLLDCRMPRGGALQVLARLRADPAAASGEAATVATSAECSPGDRQHLLDAGFCDVLVKPCDLAALQRLLDGARARARAPLLDDAAGLASSGNRDVMLALRALLRAELATLDRELDALAAEPPLLVERLHRLRSSCGFCGALALASQVVHLQGQLYAGRASPSSMARFRQALGTTIRALPAESGERALSS